MKPSGLPFARCTSDHRVRRTFPLCDAGGAINEPRQQTLGLSAGRSLGGHAARVAGRIPISHRLGRAPAFERRGPQRRARIPCWVTPVIGADVRARSALGSGSGRAPAGSAQSPDRIVAGCCAGVGTRSACSIQCRCAFRNRLSRCATRRRHHGIASEDPRDRPLVDRLTNAGERGRLRGETPLLAARGATAVSGRDLRALLQDQVLARIGREQWERRWLVRTRSLGGGYFGVVPVGCGGLVEVRELGVVSNGFERGAEDREAGFGDREGVVVFGVLCAAVEHGHE